MAVGDSRCPSPHPTVGQMFTGGHFAANNLLGTVVDVLQWVQAQRSQIAVGDMKIISKHNLCKKKKCMLVKLKPTIMIIQSTCCKLFQMATNGTVCLYNNSEPEMGVVM